MAKKSPRNNRSSIKYRWIQLDLPCIDPGDTAPARGTPVGCCSQAKCDGKIASSSSNWTVTTPEFITAVGQFWKAVCQPVNVSQTNAGVESTTFLQKVNDRGYSGSAGTEKTSIPLHSDLLLSDPKSISCFSPTEKSDFEHIKAIKRMILFDPYRAFVNSSFQGQTGVREFIKVVGSEMMAAVTNLGDPHQLVTKYEKIDESSSLKSRINLTDIDRELVTENCDLEESMMQTDVSATHSAKLHISFATNRDSSIRYSRETSCVESGTNLADNQESSEGDLGSSVEKFEQSSTSLYDAYLGPPFTSVSEPITVSSCSNSTLCSDYNIECSPSIYCKRCPQSLDSCHTVVELAEDSLPEEDNTVSDSKKNDPVVHRRFSPNVWLSVQNKIEDAIVKGKHAIAGGLAGIFVSLCLHPLDTVKTVIQADGLNQKPILHTVESIISERGVLGLYRGIASNIVSSAPVSAVYTYTYESVKGILLPVLPKEYHSLAHCTAGGCASIATSFIFTPSERIKQQMQVHSCYQNSWNALIGVLEKGGLPSLYAGWSAVLCRNIPHSIIKFYTYERLKQLFRTARSRSSPGMSSTGSDASEEAAGDQPAAPAPSRRLEGKVALVTGGASGIGESIVRLFLEHGAKVCAVDVQDSLGHELCRSLGGEPSLCFLHCDVTNEDDVSRAVDFAIDKYGNLDVLVNNAGVSGQPVADIRDFDYAEFKKVFDVNVHGAFLGMKHAARVMVPRGKGSIVSIGSVAGVVGGLGPHAYTSSKHAVVGLTRNVAAELGKHGVRVNCVSPYAVATGLALPHLPPGQAREDAVKAFHAFVGKSANLQGVTLTARDVAEAVLYLASEEARYISGLNLTVDGGFSCVNHSLQVFR